MTDRRRDWKADLGAKARARAMKRTDLLVQLDGTRQEIRKCGLDFERYDAIKRKQREIIAQLATL